MPSCSDVLSYGIFEYNEKYEKVDYARQTIKFFNQNKAQSKEQTFDLAKKADIILPEQGLNLPMKLEGTFGSKNSNYFSEALEIYFSEDVKYTREYIEKNSTVSTSLVNTWLNCMQENRAGIIPEVDYGIVVKDGEEKQQGQLITIKLIFKELVGGHSGKIKINKKQLSREIKKLGFEFINEDSFIETLVPRGNELIIRRPLKELKYDKILPIKSNNINYYCSIKFNPIIEEEIKRETNPTSYPLIAQGSQSCTYPVTNDRGHHVYLKVSVIFNISCRDASAVNIRLKVKREEELTYLLNRRVVQPVPGWINVQYDHPREFPFFLKSELYFEADWDWEEGSNIDFGKSRVTIIVTY